MSWPLATTLDSSNQVVTVAQFWREFWQYFFDGGDHTLQKGATAITLPTAQVETEHFRLWDKQKGTPSQPEKLVILSGTQLGETAYRLGLSGALTTGTRRNVRQAFTTLLIVRARPDFDWTGTATNSQDMGRKLVAQAGGYCKLIVDNFRWALGDKGMKDVRTQGPGEELETDQYVARVVTVTGFIDWTMDDTLATP